MKRRYAMCSFLDYFSIFLLTCPKFHIHELMLPLSVVLKKSTPRNSLAARAQKPSDMHL